MARVREPSTLKSGVMPHPSFALPEVEAALNTEKRTAVENLLKLCLQGHTFYRSPHRFFQLSWAFATNLAGQVEIVRILTLPAFKKLLQLEPIFPFKHLTRDYLVRGLPSAARAASFANHYRRLNTTFPPPILKQIL